MYPKSVPVAEVSSIPVTDASGSASTVPAIVVNSIPEGNASTVITSVTEFKFTVNPIPVISTCCPIAMVGCENPLQLNSEEFQKDSLQPNAGPPMVVVKALPVTVILRPLSPQFSIPHLSEPQPSFGKASTLLSAVVKLIPVGMKSISLRSFQLPTFQVNALQVLEVTSMLLPILKP